MDLPDPERHPQRPWWRRWWGSRSERRAWRWVKQRGWTIVARNVACHLGELDVVALDGTTLVVLEIRSTSGPDPARPAASVDHEKQRRLSRMALWFRRRFHFQALDLRLDVLAIAWPDGQHPIFEHHPNAFPIQDPTALDG